MRTYIFIFSLICIASCNNIPVQKIVKKKNLDSFILTNVKNNSTKINYNNKAKIFFSLDPECPLCTSYIQKMNKIHQTYKDEIDFYGFLPSPVFSEEKTKKFTKKNDVTMTIIVDTNQILTYFLDAKVTPECFLLDRDLNIIYSGLIDDWIRELGRKGQSIHNEYLLNAIEAYLKDQPIINKKTNAIGCIIERLP